MQNKAPTGYNLMCEKIDLHIYIHTFMSTLVLSQVHIQKTPHQISLEIRDKLKRFPTTNLFLVKICQKVMQFYENIILY